MYHDFVPKKLHSQADALIADMDELTIPLSHCPYCQNEKLYVINSKSGYYRCRKCSKSVNRNIDTPFYGLSPLNWFTIIANRRLCGLSNASIRHELGRGSPWMIKRRIDIIEAHMEAKYPELYEWYQDVTQAPKVEIPKIALKQAKQLKTWVTNISQTTQAKCYHCDSTDTQKVGESRAKFRCKNCWRYFNHLKGTQLEHLSHSELWLTTIDLLVEGKNNLQVKQALKVSYNTASKMRMYWQKIMKEQGLLELRTWVVGARGR